MCKKRDNDPRVCLENLESEAGFRAQCSPTRWLGRAFSSEADPGRSRGANPSMGGGSGSAQSIFPRSEEHTSELQSPCNLVCRLLLEKKKTGLFGTAPGQVVSYTRSR